MSILLGAWLCAGAGLTFAQVNTGLILPGPTTTIGTNPAPAYALTDVAADDYGDVFVASFDAQQVQEFIPNGTGYTVKTLVTPANQIYPDSVAVGPDRTLYIVSDQAGYYTFAYPYTATSPPYTVNGAKSLGVDGLNYIYLMVSTSRSSTQVYKTTAGSVNYQQIASINNGSLQQMRVAPDGTVYLSDRAGDFYKLTQSSTYSYSVSQPAAMYTASSQVFSIGIDPSGIWYESYPPSIYAEANPYIGLGNFGESNEPNTFDFDPSGVAYVATLDGQNQTGAGSVLRLTTLIPDPFTNPVGVADTITLPGAAPAKATATGAGLLPGELSSSTNVGCPYPRNYCYLYLTVTPSVPGWRPSMPQFSTTSGTVQLAFPEPMQAIGPLLTASPGTQTAILPAGNFSGGSDLLVDGTGKLYIADPGNNRVASTYQNNGTTAVTDFQAGLYKPGAIAERPDGAIYVAIPSLNSIQLMTPNGNGTNSFATVSDIYHYGVNSPTRLQLDAQLNLYILDSGNNRILKYAPMNGVYTPTVVASMAGIQSMAVDGAGNVFFSTVSNYLATIYEASLSGGAWNLSTVTSGTIVASQALLATDPVGNVYLAAIGNQPGPLYVFSNQSGSWQSSIVGSFFDTPTALTVDPNGNLYILDTAGAVNEYNFSSPTLRLSETQNGVASNAVTLNFFNQGNAAMTLTPPSSGTNPSPSAGYSIGNSSTCPVLSASSSTGSIAAGASCTIVLTYTPGSGTARNGSLNWSYSLPGVTATQTRSFALNAPATFSKLVASVPNKNIIAGVPQTVTVTALDTNGFTYLADNDLISITSNSPNSYSGFVSLSNGVATIPNYKFTTTGTASVTVTDSTTGNTYANPNIGTVDALSGFTFSQPGNAAAGVSTQTSLNAVDSGNQRLGGYADSVSLSSSDPGATFSPNPITFSNGQANVNVTFARGGTNTITASDSLLNVSTTSSGIAVSALSGFTVTPAATSVSAGTVQTVTVKAVNAGGGTFPYSGTATVTATDATVQLPSSITFSNGTATFSMTATKAGSFQVTVSGGTYTGTSASVTVSAGATASIAELTGWPQSTAVNTAFATPFSVQVTDAYGNPNIGASVVFTASGSAGSANATFPTAASATVTTDANGKASVTMAANDFPGTFNVAVTVNGAQITLPFTITVPSGFGFPATAVGSYSAAQRVYFVFNSAATLASTTAGAIRMVDRNGTGAEFFRQGTGTTCQASHAYTSGQTCAISVEFSPLTAGARLGAAQLLDGNNNVVATTYLSGQGLAPLGLFTPGIVSTLPLPSTLQTVRGLTVDANRTLYFSDAGTHAVYEYAYPYTSTTPTATFTTPYPSGTAVDGAGNLFFGDYTNNAVYEVPANSSTPVQIASGWAPENDMVADGSGNLYSPDSNTGYIYEIAAGTHTVTTILGANNVGRVGGLTIDSSGNLYLITLASSTLYEIPAGSNTATVVLPASAFPGLYLPQGLVIDPAGNLYVTGSYGAATYKVTAGTLAVNQMAGTSGGYGICLDDAGNLFTSTNTGVQKYARSNGATAFPATKNGSTTSAQNVVLENDGTAALAIASVSTNSQNFPIGTMTASSGSSASSLLPGGVLTVPISFAPTGIGPYTWPLTVTDNNLNVGGTQQGATLTGTGLVNDTLLKFSTPPNATSNVGDKVGTVAVSLEDQYGNIATTENSTVVTLVLTAPDTTSQTFTATVASGTATFNLTAVAYSQAGRYSFVATATGFQTATTTPTASRISQTITFATIPSVPYGSSINLNSYATTNSGLALVFASTAPSVCSVTSTGVVTALQAGTCSVTADQAGNYQYLAAGEATASFSISLSAPGTPTGVVAVPGNAQAVVSFTPSANNGGGMNGSISLSGFQVTSSGGQVVRVAASPATITGLTNGTAYTFTVSAYNPGGASPNSAASNSVTPQGSDSGLLWLVLSNGSVGKFTQGGLSVVTPFNAAGTASTLGGVAVDANAAVWSVSSGNNALQFAASAGTGATSFTGGGLNAPVAVAVDGAGQIWVANSGAATVSAFTATGTAITSTSGFAAGGSGASDIALDASGSVWVTNNASAGTVTRIIGAAAPTVSPVSSATAGSEP